MSAQVGSRASAGNFRSKDVFGMRLLQRRHAAMVAESPLTGVDDRAVIDWINLKWLSSEHACGSRGISKDAIGRNP
jgi:hypothetical protein